MLSWAPSPTRIGSFRAGLPLMGPRHWAEGSLGSRKPQQSQTSLVTWEVRACLRKPQDWVTFRRSLNLSGLPFPQEDSDRSTSGRGHGSAWDQNSANISYTRTGLRGGAGVRSSCRHSGTRACLSRERRAGQEMGESLSTLPCIGLPVPTCGSPASGGPAAPGSGLERPGGAALRLRTQSRGLLSVCARCVRSAEETASLSRCSSWKPQGRPSVGLRLWHPRGCGHGRLLKAPAKFFLDEKFYVCAPRFPLLLTALLLPDPRQELPCIFSASTNRLFFSKPPEGACEHLEWVPPTPHPLLGLPPPKSGAQGALHDLPRALPALTSPLFPPHSLCSRHVGLLATLPFTWKVLPQVPTGLLLSSVWPLRWHLIKESKPCHSPKTSLPSPLSCLSSIASNPPHSPVFI